MYSNKNFFVGFVLVIKSDFKSQSTIVYTDLVKVKQFIDSLFMEITKIDFLVINIAIIKLINKSFWMTAHDYHQVLTSSFRH